VLSRQVRIATYGNSRVALYTLVHKGLRARLSNVSVKAGTLNYADQAALDAFLNKCKLSEHRCASITIGKSALFIRCWLMKSLAALNILRTNIEWHNIVFTASSLI
jgi:hypothetical protein